MQLPGCYPRTLQPPQALNCCAAAGTWLKLNCCCVEVHRRGRSRRASVHTIVRVASEAVGRAVGQRHALRPWIPGRVRPIVCVHHLVVKAAAVAFCSGRQPLCSARALHPVAAVPPALLEAVTPNSTRSSCSIVAVAGRASWYPLRLVGCCLAARDLWCRSSVGVCTPPRWRN